jgi:hypothetical protein
MTHHAGLRDGQADASAVVVLELVADGNDHHVCRLLGKRHKLCAMALD